MSHHVFDTFQYCFDICIIYSNPQNRGFLKLAYMYDSNTNKIDVYYKYKII